MDRDAPLGGTLNDYPSSRRAKEVGRCGGPTRDLEDEEEWMDLDLSSQWITLTSFNLFVYFFGGNGLPHLNI